MFYISTEQTQLILLIIFSVLSFLAANIITGSLTASGILVMMLVTRKTARKLFISQWKRTDKNQFERRCSNPSLDYHLDMYNQGLKYREKNKQFIKRVHIVNDNLNLYGEYFDFGNKKSVIIIPGRSETCYYGCYYAEVFEKNGYNVLTFDARAHGISEGIYNTLGILESKDVIKWAKYLHEHFMQDSITLYGICGGATCSCFVLTDKSCPTYIDSFISDGMYYSFFETYREHIKEKKKPVYPVIWHFFSLFKKLAKVDPYSAAPYKMVKNFNVPLLIISGENDIFALPEYAKKLFETARSDDKYLAIIPHARHSHVRYDNKAEFDAVVSDFLTHLNAKR